MKTIIFDFDGTLADTLKMVRYLSDEILTSLGRDTLSDGEIDKMRSMTIPQGLRYLKLPLYRLPQLALQGRNLMRERIDSLEPISGISDVLARLRKDGHQLAIVTSNSEENVVEFLKRQKLLSHFDFIEAGAGAFNKAHRLKQTMRRHELEPEDCIYVGDEVRDVQAAKAVDMPVIAVSWGINHTDILEENEPDAIVDTPEALYEQIGEMA